LNKLFSNIRDINLSKKNSWSENVFLTFDIDWASDDVLLDTIELVERADVAATWFVTHQTPLLDRLRGNPKFELGIHPNFNFLLDGDPRAGKTAAEVIERMMRVVPEAKSVRSHSMAQTSRILDLFVDHGLIYDCNHFIPEQSEIVLKPWRHWNGMIKVPYFWEDDISIVYKHGTSIGSLADAVGLKTFDFHPIHVFLNTEKLDRYERTRPLHTLARELVEHRFQGQGTRGCLKTLLGLRE
jgi:hypothetical protein